MTTLHWPGGTINPNDPGGTLRAWQQSWCTGKGYSLGYNFCVFPDGSQWEVRGWDIACAANGNQTVNVPAIAINLCVPDVNTAPSAAMVEGVVDLIEQTRSRQPAAVIINGHRDVRPEPTQCPGDVIYQWITQGIFEPSGWVPPQPEPEPEPEKDTDDMALVSRHPITGQIYVVSIGLATKRPVSQAEHDSLVSTGRYLVVALTPETLDAIPEPVAA